MELRKDYILNRWVIISEGRGKRPVDFEAVNAVKKNSCVFCKGNEAQTPPEVYKVEKDGKWKVRVIPNKFSAVDPNGDSIIQTHNKYYTFAGDHGVHEIVIETPDHGQNFGDLSEHEMVDIFKTYSNRIDALAQDPKVNYVCLFKNQGKEAGASINHPHSQLVSLAMMPPTLTEKLDAIKRNGNFCPYCEIISKEKDSQRRCFENDSFIAFAPYASRFNYEVWIFPKKHVRTFSEIDEKMYADLAQVMKYLTQKLEGENIDFDAVWYYSPKEENLHFHIEITPRVALWAGFEIGFGIIINTVSPEEAAKFYRGEK